MKKEGYAIRDQDAHHFVTLTVVDWVDVFSRKVYRDILLDSLQFCQQNKGLTLTAYVVMTNHVHMIVRCENGKLSDLLRDIKKFTAQKILEQIDQVGESRADWMLKRFEFAAKRNRKNSFYHFWQSSNHPEEIFTEPFLWSKINYIHMNPVRAGIVRRASDYLYSSASNYTLEEGLIDVTLAPAPKINAIKSAGYDADISLW